MDNPEKLATLGTQDTGRRQTKQKTNPYTQANTNNVNEPSFKSTGDKYKTNIVFIQKS